MSPLRSHLTYANVMATIAVSVALGGTSYAVATITSKDVKNNSLTGKDVKNNSLTTKDVKNLTVDDFKSGQLGSAGQGPKGETGEKGEKGDKGEKGEPGTNAATSAVIRRATSTAVANNANTTATAACQTGEKLLGGGGGWLNSISDTIQPQSRVSYSGPSNAEGTTATADAAAATAWTVKGQNSNGQFAERITAYAICVSP